MIIAKQALWQHFNAVHQPNPTDALNEIIRQVLSTVTEPMPSAFGLIDSILSLGLPSFFCNTGYQGGVVTTPWISCLVSHIITCNIAMDSAFISAQNGIFSCTLCECTSKLQHFLQRNLLN